MPAWQLATVRTEAQKAGLAEIYHNPQSAVVSFSSLQAGFKRLNVYYSTGTVGTCMDHPTKGHTQLFRRNVGFDLLMQLMRQPRMHTGAGYHRKRPREHATPPRRPAQRLASANGHRAPSAVHGGDDQGDDDFGPDPADEETEARAERHRLLAEAAAVAAQLADVDAVLEEHTRRRQQREREAAELLRQQELQRQQAAAAAQAVAARAAEAEARRQQAVAKAQRMHERGSYYTVSISNAEAHADYMRRCGTVDSFKSVKHAAVCNGGFFIARDNGKSYWHNLPQLLGTRLVEENQNTQGALSYVAAGSDAYYAHLSSGAIWWNTTGLTDPDAFDAAVESNRGVRRIEFGEGGSWIIMFEDGGSLFQGLPTQLHNKLRSRNPRLPGATEVALGPDQTWFVRYSDGKTDWLLPTHVADTCNSVVSNGGAVTRVSMCADSSDYMVRSTVP